MRTRMWILSLSTWQRLISDFYNNGSNSNQICTSVTSISHTIRFHTMPFLSSLIQLNVHQPSVLFLSPTSTSQSRKRSGATWNWFMNKWRTNHKRSGKMLFKKIGKLCWEIVKFVDSILNIGKNTNRKSPIGLFWVSECMNLTKIKCWFGQLTPWLLNFMRKVRKNSNWPFLPSRRLVAFLIIRYSKSFSTAPPLWSWDDWIVTSAT